MRAPQPACVSALPMARPRQLVTPWRSQAAETALARRHDPRTLLARRGVHATVCGLSSPSCSSGSLKDTDAGDFARLGERTRIPREGDSSPAAVPGRAREPLDEAAGRRTLKDGWAALAPSIDEGRVPPGGPAWLAGRRIQLRDRGTGRGPMPSSPSSAASAGSPGSSEGAPRPSLPPRDAAAPALRSVGERVCARASTAGETRTRCGT